ncbi:MAG: family 78 glycoside hydrolase catalytic domain, partial [Opitutales bacterium]
MPELSELTQCGDPHHILEHFAPLFLSKTMLKYRHNLKSAKFEFALLISIAANLLIAFNPLGAAPTHLVDERPVEYERLKDGTILLDFGKVGFGNLRVKVPGSAAGTVVFHTGESFKNGRVDRKPPGTVRYKTFTAELTGGTETV